MFGPPLHLQPLEAFVALPSPAVSPLKAALPAPACAPAVAEQIAEAASSDVSVITKRLRMPEAVEANILGKLLSLARDIRRDRNYVGYSFFVLFGLAKKCKPFVWEGENLVDVIDTFAPWATEQCISECAVQAVCVCFECLEGGECRMVRVSEDHPLAQTKHFLASVSIGHDLSCEGDSLQAFYQRRGVAVLGTVVDGDCGVDCACMMLGRCQSLEERSKLRRDVSDFLLERVEERWLQDLMVACGEIDGEELLLHRSLQPASNALVDLTGDAGEAQEEKANSAVAVSTHSTTGNIDKYRAALEWATGVKDDGILLSLFKELPEAVLNEQLQSYERRDSQKESEKEPRREHFPESNVSGQDTISAAFDDYLQKQGLGDDKRLPRHAIRKFLEAGYHVPKKCKDVTTKLRRWHRRWKEKQNTEKCQLRKTRSKVVRVRYHKRRRDFGYQGTSLTKMSWVRQELFEWFVGMRYQIDWKKVAERDRSRGDRKCIGRFPRSLLQTKLHQLIQEYCCSSLLAGVKPKVAQVRSRWFQAWAEEYGLCMRIPNRRYKIPKWILQERLRIWWITLARLRALALKCLGYDLEMENFDQSPFHNNEIGAQNKPILAVAGLSSVPLIEGRHDCLQRWTGNFTTWSDVDRIEREGPPYCELMFKAAPEGRVTLQLREHLRSCGYGSWITVVCQEKGSYRETDVLNFLEKHLPPLTDGRKWRIMMADDYGPHKSDAVSDLCWSRGYVMVAHGGGATPVAQTPDTDLNQHVRREYSAKESVELMYQMRTGVAVPCAKKETSMDMLHDVLSQKRLHLNAAKGFKRTGATVALDGSEDHLIVREAGDFFKDLGMRAKINDAVETVTEEATAGRLRWVKADVKRLIGRYPARSEYDAVLERMGDHDWLEEGDTPWLSEEEKECDSSEHESSQDTDEETAGVTVQEQSATAEESAVDATARCSESALALTAEQAEEHHGSQTLINALMQSVEACRAVGSMSSVVHLENEIRKERRRERNLATESPAVAAALARRRDEERLQKIEQERAASQMNRLQESAVAAKRELEQTQELLRKRKAEVLQQEKISESRHAIKTFTVDLLGQGCANAAGVQGRKRRCEVLDRMTRLGSGLSAPQRNDWDWFKHAWDEKMKAEHSSNWGQVFAGIIQRLLNDLALGTSNAFSLFVNTETKRCFDGVGALQVPGNSS